MTRPASLVLALMAFVVVATANSGGYRFGVSDQAFYVPAVALQADPSLYPRDRAILEPQMRLWMGDEWLGALARATGGRLPELFALLYGVTLLLLAFGGVALARNLGCGWPTIATFLVLLTLRHRIAKTGANSLEGYFHPRMLAFALGVFALAAILRHRRRNAVLWTIASAVVHTTTAIWFGGVVLVAAVWPWARRAMPRPWGWIGAAGVGVLAFTAAVVLFHDRWVVMDPDWLAVLGEKDYLFPADWPAYAWLTNLAYPALITALYRLRASRSLTAPGESALVAGLLALMALFIVSVPLTEWRWALAVQLQVNRVFWVLDLVAILYLAWWLTAGRRAWTGRAAWSVAAALFTLAAGRGFYVVRVETNRPLASIHLADNDWTRAMLWLRTQPRNWHVLADPGHAWKFGSSVRVAAERDTPIESGKDTAFAMYDRTVARRVAERLAATTSYDEMTLEEVRRLDHALAIDVMVDRADRQFDLPVLYRNPSFVVYDLR